MYRPSVSYQMAVEGCREDRERFNSALISHGISPDYFEANSEDECTSWYSTPESEGSTDQWSGLDDIMGKVIADFPSLRVTIWENDEEPRVIPRRLDYANGRLTGVQYGVCYGPEEDTRRTEEWRGELLRGVMAELGKNGYFDAMNLIREKYHVS